MIVTAGALQPRLKPGIAIAVLRDGLSAPSARHREGIVDGDVEPSNILLTRTGNAKRIDIGAAFARQDAPPRSPRVRSVAQGSPHSPPARDGNPKGSEMNIRDSNPLHAAIDASLASLVADCPTLPISGPSLRIDRHGEFGVMRRPDIGGLGIGVGHVIRRRRTPPRTAVGRAPQ